MRPYLFLLFGIILTPSLAFAIESKMQDYPTVKLLALDKSTARTKTIEIKIGDTVQYGSLFIKAQACREANPLDKPESASFLQIWEVPINSEKSEWIFSGWMFASSPALSAMDHPVYDVWVVECQGGEAVKTTPSKTVTLKNETIIDALPKDDEVEEVSDVLDVVGDAIPAETPQDTDKSIETVIDDAVSDNVNYE